MTACRHCGQDIRAAHEWRGLRVEAAGAVFWHGLRVPGISPTKVRILHVLARTGEASHLALELVSAARSSNSVQAQISTLRDQLRRAGVPVAIRAERGLGYRFELAEHAGTARDVAG